MRASCLVFYLIPFEVLLHLIRMFRVTFLLPMQRPQVSTLMDLVCKACGELMEDAVKKNMRIRVLSTDKTMVTSEDNWDD